MQWSYTDTVFHVSEQLWGEMGVLFSQAMIFFCLLQDLYKLKHGIPIFSNQWSVWSITNDTLLTTSPTLASNNCWRKVMHQTTKHTTLISSKGTLDLFTSFLYIARRQWVCKSCIQMYSHGKALLLSPCFFVSWENFHTSKYSVQSTSKFS